MITRRCMERMFLLGARAESSAEFIYGLAEAASRFGVLVHAAVVMSNHLHCFRQHGEEVVVTIYLLSLSADADAARQVAASSR
jgi:REP element-mobilizing transposase RayT